MNKKNRSDIKKIVIRLNLIRDEIDKMKDGEEDKYDNLPENLQETSRAQDMEDAIEYLGDALDSIDEVIENLEQV